MTTNRTSREIKKNTKFDIIVDMVIIYLGIYIFFIRCSEAIIDVMPLVVLNEKKLNKSNPLKIYTGKLSIVPLNNVENTNESMIMFNRGFTKLHMIPKTEPLYFFLISFFTNKDNKYEYFLNVFK